MCWKCAMRKCNSFHCISQLTRDTKVTFFHICKCGDEASGWNTVSGIAFILRTQKKFQSYLYSVEDMASLSSETMQTIPFDPRWPKTGSNFSIKLFHNSCSKPYFFHSVSGSPTKTRQETAGRTTSTSTVVRSWRFPSQSQEMIYITASWFLKMKGEDYEPCNFFAKNFQTVCPNAWIEKWNDQREKVNITFDFLRLWQVRCAFVVKLHLIQYNSSHHSKDEQFMLSSYLSLHTQPTV